MSNQTETIASAARFLDEARITGQLQHPGVPAVYQAGHTPGGRPFLAMKLINGTTLEQSCKPAPRSARWRCSSRSARRSPMPTLMM